MWTLDEAVFKTLNILKVCTEGIWDISLYYNTINQKVKQPVLKKKNVLGIKQYIKQVAMDKWNKTGKFGICKCYFSGDSVLNAWEKKNVWENGL